MGWNWRRRTLSTAGAAAVALGSVLVVQAPAGTAPVAGSEIPSNGTITTVAGSTQGFSGDAALATMAQVVGPRQLALLPEGGYLIADGYTNRIRRVSATGTITTVAGNGHDGFSGDGGPATSADIKTPHGVRLLPDGGFLIADTFNHRIRRVTPDGVISTVAGTGTEGFSGDGGPATNAKLASPMALALLPDGGFLIADTFNHRIRRVSPTGTITTEAGTGTQGLSGDGGPAVNAKLNRPAGITVQPGGGVLIADTDNHRIRRINPSGMITTIAGTSRGFSGDGGPATNAQLQFPYEVLTQPDGGLLIADAQNGRIRQVSPVGVITTLFGGGKAPNDGGPAANAQLGFPTHLIALPDGGYLIADTTFDRISRVSAHGTITTSVGRGTVIGDGGEGSTATQAQLDSPSGVAALAGGGFLIVDTNNARVRRVSADGSRIFTVAGGRNGPDGGFAFNANLGFPSAIARRTDDSYLIADAGHNSVRTLLPNETIGTFGPTTQFGYDHPRGIALLPDGSFLVADTNNHRVKLVRTNQNGTITVTTAAGSGAIGSAGDGGQAAQAQLFSPSAVAVLPDGGFLIADSGNGRIRKVSAPSGGTITTIVGSTPGFSGDGGPATSAQLNNPRGITVLPDGEFLIADTGNHRIRRVAPDGVITTIAGTGVPGLAGDGGPAGGAQLNAPTAIDFLPDGGFLIADTGNHRIRQVT